MVATTKTTTKGMKFLAEPLTQDEVKALINACSKRAATGVRNRALLVVLYRAGLRISEALSLLPKDLDAAAGTIRVLHGKGDKARLVALDDVTDPFWGTKLLDKVAENILSAIKNPEEAVFKGNVVPKSQ